MIANENFKDSGLEFWAIVKFLNQSIGYSERRTKKNPNPKFVIPDHSKIIKAYKSKGLNPSTLTDGINYTKLGQKIVDYFKYRSDILINHVEKSLMDQPEAKKLFYLYKNRLNPTCPLPMNKQKGDKRDYNYLTGLVNMLFWKELDGKTIDYDPKAMTSFTQNNSPVRSMSRRLDGAYPSSTNPKVAWEIKEYYYTTTFGSRIADGVYETMLDGMEFREVEESLGVKVYHIVITDAHYTWWGMGKSYLCRWVDILNMGLVDEIIFGKEVVTRIPEIAKRFA